MIWEGLDTAGRIGFVVLGFERRADSPLEVIEVILVFSNELHLQPWGAVFAFVFTLRQGLTV